MAQGLGLDSPWPLESFAKASAWGETPSSLGSLLQSTASNCSNKTDRIWRQLANFCGYNRGEASGVNQVEDELDGFEKAGAIVRQKLVEFLDRAYL